MKKTAIFASFAAILALSACNETANTTADTETVTSEATAATGEGEAYKVVADQSEAKWHGTKVAGEHYGTIDIKEGELLVADDQVTGGTFVIDMASIQNTDITDAENNGKLVGHLKSDDFFGVEKYPNATFTIKSLTPIANAATGQPNYNVTGDLTVKENTNPVTFPAVISVENGVAKAKADVKIDRAKYDVRYGSNSFFDNLGDKAISDEFTVSLDLTASK
ncbi:YceI family protein [Pontibacter qinzhouensis]|uniref:YceI family protein n=1 Tax=Pontibacter qinzhouensis TaxID=2603253 RepID=A0A5C8IZG6_9BACT|nr:YceI family protein [Pontibacter qinzhouensis]TXK26315.1 YceI family protein [Pontibacter qinzhouensis]